MAFKQELLEITRGILSVLQSHILQDEMEIIPFAHRKKEPPKEVLKAPPPILEERETINAPPPTPTLTTRELARLSMKETLGKIAPHLKLIDPPAPIALLFFSQNPSERQFLESVAKAITEHFSKASVVNITTEEECVHFLKNPFLKLVLASIDDLSRFPLFEKEAKAHHLTTLLSVPYLPLHPLKTYSQDQNSKRLLWNTLKNMPQLSQILPSIKL